ncbi:MAG: hypothetical protein M1268_03135 [Patescibacteria group bacterium]|nr:hypothetical protein [Patescibacteria group bacterium]
MIDLTNLEEIKKLDPKNVYESTGMFPDQCKQMFDSYFNTEFFSDEYKSVKNIVICGMGGSAYGGHIALSLFENEIKIPLVINSNYHLPGFVNKDTLVILTSYSGSTEEVLSCAEEALKKGAKISGFSSGGKLGEFLKDKHPGFTFNPKFNPSGQPRLGTGYIAMGTFALLKSWGAIEIKNSDVESAIEDVKRSQEKIKGDAIEIAKQIQGKIPIIFASEHLVGNAHVTRNQFNETSKSFSAFEDIPELNHHLMEGLKNPIDKKLIVLFIDSQIYSSRIKKRFALTKDVIKKNNVEVIEYSPCGKTKLSQVLNTLSFGGYLTLYLALLYGQDPSLIPWVDYFKEQLKVAR